MSRLPTVFGDGNTWGEVLNDYLGVTLTACGTVKSPLSIYTRTDSLLSMDAVGSPTSNTVTRVYFSGVDDPGSHGWQSRAALGITHRATGSGSNGPNAMDATLFLSAQKINYETSNIEGQVTAGNIYVRQGLKGDASAFDINVAGYQPSSYFYCILEGVTTQFNSLSAAVDQIDVQVGVVAPNNITMGYYAIRLAGVGGNADGLRLTGPWGNYINIVTSGGQSAFKLDGDGVLQLKQPADTGRTLFIYRQTDTNPSGTLIECFNATATNNVFVVDAADPTSGYTAMRVAYNGGGGVVAQQVFVGGADTGGTGFRSLRVPN